MNKQTILSFGLGVIVGAAGMWALTPEQTTFEEGVIEYAPAAAPANTATPINKMEHPAAPAGGEMQPQDGSNPSMNSSSPTSSNETPTTSESAAPATSESAAPATSANEAAPAAAPVTSENETTEAAPAPTSSLGPEEMLSLASNTATQQPSATTVKEGNASKEVKEECCGAKHECKDASTCTDASHAKGKVTS